MSVLARDLAAYQDAVGRFKQAARSHNYRSKVYNASVVFQGDMPIVADDNGKLYSVGADGKLKSVGATLGDANWQYQATRVPEEPRLRLLRQNPNPDGSFPVKPPEWSAPALPDRPEPTSAQLKKVYGRDAMADERGLIGDAMTAIQPLGQSRL